MKFVYPEGATPYNQDDAEALLPQHITTQDQLNEWEQANILEAERWLFSRKQKDLLSVPFLQKLHKRMFDKTWKWAGRFRTHNTNIGIPYPVIQESLKALCDDVTYWVHHKTFPIDEIAARFHHRLVQIHAFPNGNGSHARLMADALLVNNGRSRFIWGRKSLVHASQTRDTYIKALKNADRGDETLLLRFVRS